jgi:hypothetical protein
VSHPGSSPFYVPETVTEVFVEPPLAWIHKCAECGVDMDCNGIQYVGQRQCGVEPENHACDACVEKEFGDANRHDHP